MQEFSKYTLPINNSPELLNYINATENYGKAMLTENYKLEKSLQDCVTGKYQNPDSDDISEIMEYTFFQKKDPNYPYLDWDVISYDSYRSTDPKVCGDKIFNWDKLYDQKSSEMKKKTAEFITKNLDEFTKYLHEKINPSVIKQTIEDFVSFVVPNLPKINQIIVKCYQSQYVSGRHYKLVLTPDTVIEVMNYLSSEDLEEAAERVFKKKNVEVSLVSKRFFANPQDYKNSYNDKEYQNEKYKNNQKNWAIRLVSYEFFRFIFNSFVKKLYLTQQEYTLTKKDIAEFIEQKITELLSFNPMELKDNYLIPYQETYQKIRDNSNELKNNIDTIYLSADPIAQVAIISHENHKKLALDYSKQLEEMLNKITEEMREKINQLSLKIGKIEEQPNYLEIMQMMHYDLLYGIRVALTAIYQRFPYAQEYFSSAGTPNDTLLEKLKLKPNRKGGWNVYGQRMIE